VASFYKRGKTWTLTMDVGIDKNGKRKQRQIGGFRTKKEAEEAAAQLSNELSKGTFIEEAEITFREFSQEWLEMYSSQVKKSTTRIRQHEVNNLLRYFDRIKLKDITKKQYQNALYDLPKRGFAERTIAGIHGTARMIFKKAVELEVIKKDPTEYARPPRKVETLEDIEKSDELPKFLEKEELAAFLRLAHDAGLKDDYAIFTLLAYTGIRGGELCALKWSDIDFESRTIKITKTYFNPQNNIKLYELQPPKTRSSKRIIIVSQKIIKELEKHQARQNKTKMRNRDVWHDENFVFSVDKHPGYPIYLKLIEGRMARILKIAGLNQKLTPHSLRHTHTSLLAEAGVGLEEIMERLGHTDDDTTRRVYLHVTKDMKKEAAHKFDELMNSL